MRRARLTLMLGALAALSVSCTRTGPPEGQASAASTPGSAFSVRVVTGANQKPVVDAYVILSRNLQRYHEASRAGFHGVGKDASGRTDSDGYLRLSKSPNGLQVQVTANGFHGFADNVSSDHVVVTLAPVLQLRGHVLFADGGPAPGAEIYVMGPYQRQTTADADGGFAIDNPNDGQPLVGQLGSQFGVWSAPREAVDGEIILTDQREYGTVMDIRKRPLAGVEVTMTMGLVRFQQVTGKDGRWFKPLIDANCLRPGDIYYPELPCSREFRFHLEGYVDQTIDGKTVQPVFLQPQKPTPP